MPLCGDRPTLRLLQHQQQPVGAGFRFDLKEQLSGLRIVPAQHLNPLFQASVNMPDRQIPRHTRMKLGQQW